MIAIASLPVNTFNAESSEYVPGWLQKSELIPNAFHYFDNVWIVHAIYFLKGGADVAITTALLLQSTENREQSTSNWETLKSRIKERCIPKNQEWIVRKDMRNLKMHCTIKEYIGKSCPLFSRFEAQITKKKPSSNF